ncbi:MAG: zf-HC2 domain-containing protein [Phycisphaerae bacterium]|jgi:anti-sigma factor RsiW
MNPIEPAELSAYLDGELSPRRAREVESALATDPALRAEYERLAALDASWRDAARAAGFDPPVAVEEAQLTPGAWPAWALAGLVALLVIRIVPKFIGPALAGAGLHAAALAVILAWAVVRLGREADDTYPATRGGP